MGQKRGHKKGDQGSVCGREKGKEDGDEAVCVKNKTHQKRRIRKRRRTWEKMR